MIDPDGRDDVYSRQGKNIEHNNHEIDKKQDHIVIRDQNYVKKALGSLGLGNAKFVKSMSDNIDTRIEMTTLSAEAYSNVYTNILSKTDGFNVNDLYNGKVSIIILNNDDKTFYKNNTYNNPSEEEQNASCGKYKDNGPVKLLITATIRPGKFRDYYSTVSNVKNILFDHEYFSHGIMGWGEYDSYKYQMKTPSWNNTTDFYKQLIRKNYEDVIKPR